METKLKIRSSIHLRSYMRKMQADLSHLCILATQEDKAASISGYNLSLSLSLSLSLCISLSHTHTHTHTHTLSLSLCRVGLYPLGNRLSHIKFTLDLLIAHRTHRFDEIKKDGIIGVSYKSGKR